MSIPDPHVEEIEPQEVKKRLSAVKERMAQTVRGKEEVLDSIIICLLARGHILLEDLPGMGKTTIAYTLARSLDANFARIQFTSDLLPADVLGVSIYDEHRKEFVLKKGPLFTNILLADEINRASPKTQSSLLEVMDRNKVSIDGETIALSSPFMVIATQNPIDHQSTFPLPDSQMDRFLMRMEIGYPGEREEIEILKRGHLHYDDLSHEPVLSRHELASFQTLSEQVFAEDSILHYVRALAQATREDAFFKVGISPRGALALLRTAQARALYEGRSYVLPDDVSDGVHLVWMHRLRSAQNLPVREENSAVDEQLSRLLTEIPRPV